MLLLDQCGHLMEETITCVRAWQEAAPELTVLQVGRYGRATPGADHIRVEELAPEEAAAALRAWSPMEIGRKEADEVVAIVGGNPLAIRLAAAQLRRGPKALAELLTDRLRALAGGDTSLPARQRSIRASLDATWDALTPRQRWCLGALAVFASPFDLRAAFAVLRSPDGRTREEVAELLDHSVLVHAGDHRFRLTPSVRAYALEELQPKVVFELTDLARERRLRDMQALGGTPDVFRLSHGDEVSELL